ncbi:N5-glutamine methyltransferase family protein [Nonlabens marinus]|uniref:peptide chain release factor N(5)-glutamine methyltransferase n=1 Tax=Nonlabens marinus S1-08 TaxID=1454201 RepID=W8VXG2_9FLAO|nr:HemK/PrmC family methyltransferase [Nonlabens marinus]BAO55872.1 methylase of polypeptide chain release factors [Nonlabens marinus S1-08]
MILRQMRDVYVNRLEHLYPETESISIFKILCEDLLHLSKSDIMIRGEEPLSHLNEEILLKSLETLLDGKPVQQITGLAHFYGHVFKVNRHTLIPRQETEELVQWILDDHKGKTVQNVFDIGTGSGCIGISLGDAFAKANTSSNSLQITLLDVSKEALQVAGANAKAIAPVVAINCIEKDILQEDSLGDYDIIVSNPPYVRELEKSQLHINVIDHEPGTALFVTDENPLVFYIKILELATSQARPLVYFEINQYLPEQMKNLAAQLGYKSEIRNDLNGNARMMKCWK